MAQALEEQIVGEVPRSASLLQQGLRDAFDVRVTRGVDTGYDAVIRRARTRGSLREGRT